MGNYSDYKKSQKDLLTHELLLYRKFHKLVFEEKTLQLTEEELRVFQECRQEDDRDYKLRKILYGPSVVGGLFLFDNVVSIPYTKNNFVRGVWNLVIGLPVAASFSVFLVFYKEQIKSHQYAFRLCGKYGVDVDQDDRLEENS